MHLLQAEGAEQFLTYPNLLVNCISLMKYAVSKESTEAGKLLVYFSKTPKGLEELFSEPRVIEAFKTVAARSDSAKFCVYEVSVF